MILGIEIKNIHVNIKDSSPEEVQKWVEENPQLSEAMRIAAEAFEDTDARE